MNHRQLLTIGMFASTCAAAMAENWPGFRGPHSDGIADGLKLPIEWSAQKNVAWQVKIPGEAWSSPVVWGDKVFVTTAVENEEAKATRIAKEKEEKPPADGEGGGQGRGRGGRRNRDGQPPETVYRWEVHALDAASGKTLWKQLAHEGRPPIPKHQDNTFATETPVTDGERVCAYFGMIGVFCYDHSGKLLWKKEFGVYPMQSDFGTSSSPVLHEGSLFLQVDNEQNSLLAALDVKTGEEKWRVPREEKSTWSSPIIWRNKLRTELVAGGLIARAYEPATGKLLWQLDLGGGRSSATAVGDLERLYIGNELRGQNERPGGTLFGVKAGASGDITPKEGKTTSEGVAWSIPKAAPEAASPVSYKGLLYVIDRMGAKIDAFNAETGAVVYERQRIPGAGNFWASLWACDDRIYCLDEKGATHILAAGAEFKVLATSKLADRFWSTPSAVNGRLFLRGAETLYCIKQ